MSARDAQLRLFVDLGPAGTTESGLRSSSEPFPEGPRLGHAHVRGRTTLETLNVLRNGSRNELPGSQDHQHAEHDEPDTFGRVPGPELGPSIFHLSLRFPFQGAE
jgi:hypothetical protein